MKVKWTMENKKIPKNVMDAALHCNLRFKSLEQYREEKTKTRTDKEK